jgi:hypothetical protein
MLDKRNDAHNHVYNDAPHCIFLVVDDMTRILLVTKYLNDQKYPTGNQLIKSKRSKKHTDKKR